MAQDWLDVSATTPRIYYTVGATPQTVFNVPFVFFGDADLEVYVDDVLKTLTVDYTVSGKEIEAGGQVIFNTALTSRRVAIVRSIDIALDTHVPTFGPLDVGSINRQFSRFIAIQQELASLFDRTIHLPESAPVAEVGLTVPVPGEWLRWNATGDGFESAPVVLPDGGISIATQSEAEAGTANDKISTPLRVSQQLAKAGGTIRGTAGAIGSPAIAYFRTLNQLFRQIPTLYDFGFTNYTFDASGQNAQRFADMIAFCASNPDVREIGIPAGNWGVGAWPGKITTPISFRGVGRDTSYFYPNFDVPSSSFGLLTYGSGLEGYYLRDFGIIKQKANSNGCNIAIVRDNAAVSLGRISLSNLYLSGANNSVEYQLLVKGTSPAGAATPAVRGISVSDCNIFGAAFKSVVFDTVSGIIMSGGNVSLAGGSDGTLEITGDANWSSANNLIEPCAVNALSMSFCKDSQVRAGYAGNVFIGSTVADSKVSVGKRAGGYTNQSISCSYEEGITGTIRGNRDYGLQFLPNCRMRKWAIVGCGTTLQTFSWASLLGGSNVPFTDIPVMLSASVRGGGAAYASYANESATAFDLIASTSAQVRVVAEGPYV